MAIHLAHFVAITGGQKTLRVGGDIDADIPFDLPSDAGIGNSSVLTFMLDAAAPSNLSYSVSINGTPTQITNRVIDSATRHAEQEIVTGLRVGANTLRVALTGGTGTLVISDIVLHYNRLR